MNIMPMNNNIKGNKKLIAVKSQKELQKNGVFRLKIKILKTLAKEIMIGIAPIDFNLNKPNYEDFGWHFYCKTQYYFQARLITSIIRIQI